MSVGSDDEGEDLASNWEEHADDWAHFARSPRHDHFFWDFNGPRFLQLVPAPGDLTLDIACGEGRLGRLLAERGHRVLAIDRSPSLARMAKEGGDQEIAVGDAAALPVATGIADIATAFMSLQDIPGLEASVKEVARALVPGGTFCIAIAHPLRSAGRFAGKHADSEFILTSYFDERRWPWSTQHTGVRITLPGVHRPLEAYTGALESAGFVIETLNEPRPSSEDVAGHEASARWVRIPCFLHLRAVLRE